MEQEDHYRKLERMYLEAPVNEPYGPDIKVGDRKASIKMEVGPQHHHGGGAVHGSLYFKMLDDAAFFASNSVIKDEFVVTTQFDMQLVRPVKEGNLEAVGKVRTLTRQHIVAEATLYDPKGKELAFGSGTFMKSGLALEDAMNYE